ncbi:MAG: 50S ribosomal protein L11 methyltransferase [Luminiphilus sp.]
MSADAAWQELHFTARKDQVQVLEEWLFERGALSVTLEDDADQPLLEPGPGETPLWDVVRVTALYVGDQDITPILGEIPPNLITSASRAPVPVADREWARVWENEFHPLQMGERLWICPSWTPPPDPDAINILLDPGLAFGTGTHPTTAMCLRSMDADLGSGARVVDYGCGSGILGIAAVRLGATAALGVDNDPQAITASLNNAARNHVPREAFSVVLPEDELVSSWRGAATWVVANILAGPLVALAPVLTSLMTPGGRLLLAGLLADQAEEVIKAYAPTVDLVIADQQEGWVLLSGNKR